MESSNNVLHLSPVHILEGSDEVALSFSQISCGAFHNGAITEGGEVRRERTNLTYNHTPIRVESSPTLNLTLPHVM